jgi:hypothetical protein
MNHPYREPAPGRHLFKEWTEGAPCWSCERRAALAAKRRRRAWHALGVALLATHTALAGVAIACIPLDSRLLAEAQKIDADAEKIEADAVEALRQAHPSATTAAPLPPAAPPGIAASPGAMQSPDPLEWRVGLGIVQLGATEFIVDRRSIAVALQYEADLLRSSRIVPEVENGRVVGVRLWGVRPNTLPGRFGFEDGDRLESINGVSLHTPSRALAAYAQFRTASEVSIVVTRRGERIRLDYHVV